MKTIYQVMISDYGYTRVYGAFEKKELAQKLCEEVQSYFISIENHNDEVYINEMNIYDESDIIYRYSTHVSIQDKTDIHTDVMAPTYMPNNGMSIEYVKEKLSEGVTIYGALRYGRTKEEAVQAAIDFYNELEKENLIEPLIKIIVDRQNKNQS